MTLSASVSMVPSSLSFNNPSTALVTVSNSGGSNVKLVSLTPIVNSDGSKGTAVSSINLQAPNASVVVPATGSVIVPFQIVCWAPQGPNLSSLSPSVYSIGANLITSDGSSFSATPANLTINPL